MADSLQSIKDQMKARLDEINKTLQPLQWEAQKLEKGLKTLENDAPRRGGRRPKAQSKETA
jgi:prefoldin subunit 5